MAYCKVLLAMFVLTTARYTYLVMARQIQTARDLSDEDCEGSADCSNEDCDKDPCIDAVCPAFPTAFCRPDPCEQCNAEWYVDEENPVRVDCENPEATPLCPSGWELHNRKCYFLNNFYSLTQKNAMADCSRRGGHLVDIESESEQKFIETLPINRYFQYWTSGIRKRVGSSTTWVWNSTGEDVQYTKWNFREPNNQGPPGLTEDSIGVKISGSSWGWNDVFHGYLFYYICEAHLHEVFRACDSQPCLNGGSCIPDENGEVVCSCKDGFSGQFCQVDEDTSKWYPFNGHTYQVFAERGRDRTFAAAVCQENGASLVSINDKDEQEFLGRMLKKAGLRNSYMRFYTGGFLETDRTWWWEDGTEMSYTAWDRGEPNYHKGEDLVHLFYRGSTARWNDVIGRHPTPFICERDEW